MSDTVTDFEVPWKWRDRWPVANLAGLRVEMTEDARGDLVDLRIFEGSTLLDSEDERVASLESAELAAAREEYVYVPAAYQLGKEAAESAATWTVDGTHDSAERLRVYDMLRAGDDAEEYLPRRPNLSGEMADDPTPLSIYEEVTGGDRADADADTVDALAQAFEDGVSDTFEPACEAELAKVFGAACAWCESTDTNPSGTNREGMVRYCNTCERFYQAIDTD